MINIITADDLTTPQEKEELFLQFLHSYLTFLIYMCRCSFIKCDEKRINSQQLEDCLINSLTLISHIHVTIFTLKTNYKKVNYEHGTSLIFNRKQSERVAPKLYEMKIIIDCYPFIEKANKLHCLSLLEQIQRYYELDNLVIVEADLHADPWLASHLSQYRPP